MQNMAGLDNDRTNEKRFRNHIKQFWQYMNDAEINGNEELRDEYFLSMKHGLHRSQAELILSDMKHHFFRVPEYLPA